MQPIRLKGVPGSPYTRKVLAYLRYRHIPYELLIGNQDEALGLPQPRVQLLPTVYLENDAGELEAHVDSTPLMRRFERTFAGREAIPDDPALAFLNYLIEDYADEWLTKAMFHYRWNYQSDIDMAGTVLPLWSALQATPEQHRKRKAYIAERQISRLYVVGSNRSTAPVIEASYRRLLGILDRLIAAQRFVLGARPATADFALYGQLTQLTRFDPTPSALCLEVAPRVGAWTDIVDDLSGQPADAWMAAQDAANSLHELLCEIGRTHTPALLANARALQAGEQTMHTTIDGTSWTQPVFPYQARCLQWINEAFRSLDAADRRRVLQMLDGTNCDSLLIA